MDATVDTPTSTAIRIKPCSSRGDYRRFVDFPFSLYADWPFWVPPLRVEVQKTLNPKKNAFFEHGQIQLFLALDASGTVIGRIAAIVNGMHLRKYDDGVGFFGFFECVESYDLAKALLDAAGAWLREQGLRAIRGPANPSLNDTAGLLVDGFDREPSILMPYNPPYYSAFLEEYGLQRAMTMWAYYVHRKYVKLDKLRRGADIVYRRYPSLSLRTVDMSRFKEEAHTILAIYNAAWSKNWGHVPMTDSEFDQLATDLKQIIDPRMVFILEQNGTPVAFSISIPNLNQALRHVESGRLFPFGWAKLLARAKLCGMSEVRMPLMGVLPEYHGRGYDALLVLETVEQGPKLGYTACEMSWVLDSNRVLKNALDSLGSVVDKEYAMFEKTL